MLLQFTPALLLFLIFQNIVPIFEFCYSFHVLHNLKLQIKNENKFHKALKDKIFHLKNSILPQIYRHAKKAKTNSSATAIFYSYCYLFWKVKFCTKFSLFGFDKLSNAVYNWSRTFIWHEYLEKCAKNVQNKPLLLLLCLLLLFLLLRLLLVKNSSRSRCSYRLRLLLLLLLKLKK